MTDVKDRPDYKQLNILRVKEKKRKRWMRTNSSSDRVSQDTYHCTHRDLSLVCDEGCDAYPEYETTSSA